MRTIDGLYIIDDISILIKYLYMNENASITIENSIGIKSKITLDDQFNFKREIINGVIPGQIFNSNSEFTVEFMKDVIGYLKEQPPEEFPNYFKTRWDEIKNITANNIGLNKLKGKL